MANAEKTPANLAGRHIHITGIVQGVGFRPFVYELAMRYGLHGWVLNNSSGVEIEVTGPPETLDAFISALQTQTPPLAVIDSLHTECIKSKIQNPKPVLSEIEVSKIFTIRHSESQSDAFVPISPDICICDDCLQELFDPADRRYCYPFINCTNCGPRFTIIRDIPYDRPLTTMADFPMCPDCQREYDDPLNRRFHAQPNACAKCGPQVEFRWSDKVDTNNEISGVQNSFCTPEKPFTEIASPTHTPQNPGNQAIHMAQTVIAQGSIVAVKGLGGFHLACDATNDDALQTLRHRKGRVDKPFAVMALDIATVKTFAKVNAQERKLLTSKERPIVLLKKETGNSLSQFVAPGNQYIGVMLPYTPLHYLLLTSQSKIQNPKSKIVLTSGNFSEEPIVKDNAKALERLAPLADAFLLHNRDIHIHCDDSVVRVYQGRELPIRRSRGYAPFPVKLPFQVEQILAVGGELKNTFCMTRDNYAFMSQHTGDMENLETLQAFEQSVAHFLALFRVDPKIIAYDMHPGYLSTKWAREGIESRGATLRLQEQGSDTSFTGAGGKVIGSKSKRPDDEKQRTKDKGQRTKDESPISPPQSKIQNPKPVLSEIEVSKIKVQHHHAHIAAVMAEHGLDGTTPVIGFSFDGAGYGLDGAIWGGELFLADYRTFTRMAHLKYIPLPGGDAAIKRPYRTALAHLWAAGVAWDKVLPPVAACSTVEQGIIKRQLETKLNSALTSSMGRLFDAVATLTGGRQTVTYEAQAAIEFEAMMANGITAQYEFELSLENPLAQNLPLEIDAGPIIRAVAADVQMGVARGIISAKFHNTVANLVRHLSLWLREKENINKVVLSGGVFQNITLLELIVEQLTQENFKVLTHRQVPPNDGGLALGQAVIAHFRGQQSQRNGNKDENSYQ